MGKWRRVSLGEAVSIEKGRLGAAAAPAANGAVPYLGAGDLEGRASARWALRDSAVCCEPDDVLMLWDGERSGLVGTGLAGAASSTVARLRPNRGVSSGRFVFHALRSRFEEIQGLRTGTGVPHVPRDLDRLFHLALPPLEEQRRIAEILDSIDETIQATERVIEKLRRMRDPILAAALGSETHQRRSLGTLAVVTVGHVGPVAGAYTHADESVPLFNTGSITPDGLDVSGAHRVTMEFHRAHRGSALTSGDVVVARHGDSGAAAVVPPGVSGAQALNVCIVRASESLDGAYLATLLSYEPVRRDLVGWRAGSVQGVVNTARLRSLEIPVPPIDGQRRVSGRLDAWQGRISAESDLVRKYRQTRAGLAADLLSGRVRTVAA